MNDEIEYDYYGVPITIHTKEECIYTMKNEVLVGDHYYDDTLPEERAKCGCPKSHIWLSEQDRELLVEYAPKLFDTLPKENDLFNTMLGLATIIGKHRFEVMWQKREKARMDLYSHSKKSQEDRVDALKKHIEAIKRIIGTDIYVPKDHDLAQFRTPHDDLLDELERVYQDPERYLPAVRQTKESKSSYEHNDEAGETAVVPHYTHEPMQEYLKALQLKNRTDIIKEFVQKITTQDWFSTFLVKQQRPPNL